MEASKEGEGEGRMETEESPAQQPLVEEGGDAATAIEALEKCKLTDLKDFSICLTEIVPSVTAEDLVKAFDKKIPKEDAQTVEVEMEQEQKAPPSALNPFVAAVKDEVTNRTLTEKGAPTFSTSSDPRLDFYFGVMDQTQEDRVVSMLSSSWEDDPLSTLRLIANLRDIQKGKGLRPQYVQCLYWLYENHPQTLYNNLEELVNFGYWKDLLHLLMLAMFDGFVHPFFEKDATPGDAAKKKKDKPSQLDIRRQRMREKKNKAATRRFQTYSEEAIGNVQKLRKDYDAEKRLYNQKILDYYFDKEKKNVIDIKGKDMTFYRIKFAREKFNRDNKYRAFHIKVAEIFAKRLISDQRILEDNKKDTSPSLCGKWAPSLEKHFDKYTLIATTISLMIAKFSGDKGKILFSGKPYAIITYLARKTYNKDYLIPLRRKLEIPEVKMSEGKWEEVNYRRVAAKCMTKNKKHFLKHDNDRFQLFLKCKDTKVAGATLKPVELVCEAMNMEITDENEAERIILEKQWDSLVQGILKNGGGAFLKDAVAICDVSGSMNGTPMQAAIGLTLITMGLTSPPWNQVCITFHERPELFFLEDPKMTFINKVQTLQRMPWGGTTNLHAVFEQIVSLGLKKGLSSAEMPKLLLVFTDMEFDEAFGGTNQTNFEAAESLFTKNGYTMPTIVFWNLRDSSRPARDWGAGAGSGLAKFENSTPVQKNQYGALLISGFAGQTLAYVLNAKDLNETTPLQFMLDMLADTRYEKLQIWD